jgi:hypothetical protein
MLATVPTLIRSAIRLSVQETDTVNPYSAVHRPLVQECEVHGRRAVACIHLVQAWPGNCGSVAEAALHELAEAALADEEAIADDGPAADEHGPDGATHR